MDSEPKSIVIKRIKKGGHGHHGGAWKIAYADFVTAMMAFFLLMWLLAALNKYTLQGIAEYFKKPLSEVFESQQKVGNPQTQTPGGGDTAIQDKGMPKKELIKEDMIEKSGRSKEKMEAQNQYVQAVSPEQVIEENAKELRNLQKLRMVLEEQLKANPSVKNFKSQLSIEIVKDGLRVELRDVENQPMFPPGSATPTADTKRILEAIGKEINKIPNQIVITGHTDANPHMQGFSGYGNWELSSERANAARRMLINGGMNPDKVLRVIGVADNEPLNKDNIFSPLNRRINIVILKKDVAKKISQEDKPNDEKASENPPTSENGSTQGKAVASKQDPAAAKPKAGH